MNQSKLASHFPVSESGGRLISLPARLWIYFAIWLAAAVGFETMIPIPPLGEGSRSVLVERLLRPFETPVTAAIGLAQACAWPQALWMSESPWVWVAILFFPFQLLAAFACRRLYPFIGLCLVQVIALAISLIYTLRAAELPSL